MASGIQIKPKGAANQSFHVTVHGIGDVDVFETRRDKIELLGRIQNHLGVEPLIDSAYRPYTKLHREVALLAYAVMRNHLHLVLHQFGDDGMRRLMQRLLGSYARYYNDSRGRRGAVFDGRYAAQPILDADHLKFSIAYAHLNHPIEQLDYEFVSHGNYVGKRQHDWLDARRGLAAYGGSKGYAEFMNRTGPGIVERKLISHRVDPTLHPYREFDPIPHG